MALPTDAQARKHVPIATGFLDYFPKAVAAVAALSRAANEQHNPGQPMHWDRSKSGDEADAQMRHFMERGTIDIDGHRHSTKNAWRAMALLEKELEEVEKVEKAERDERDRQWLAEFEEDLVLAQMLQHIEIAPVDIREHNEPHLRFDHELERGFRLDTRVIQEGFPDLDPRQTP